MPPTFERPTGFVRAYELLWPAEREQFMTAVREFVDDLKAGTGFRRSLRVKRVQGTRDVWEMTWAPNGRPTW